MLEYCKKKYFLIYESLERLVMYFIVAYYGCVGLIAALGEAHSISMRETEPQFATENLKYWQERHYLQLKTNDIDKNLELVKRSVWNLKLNNWIFR